jgi:GNAT superfamily N-acetyltransferase
MSGANQIVEDGTMTFTLRRLTLEEMDRAAIIQRTSFDERLPWLAGLHTPDEDRAFFRKRVFAECEIWGAADREIIGIIAFREGWIDQLYVLPGHQRLGAGDALLRVAKAVFSSLHLWTFQKNTLARSFYEKRGFKMVKETDGSDNEEREPDVLCRWQRD